MGVPQLLRSSTTCRSKLWEARQFISATSLTFATDSLRKPISCALTDAIHSNDHSKDRDRVPIGHYFLNQETVANGKDHASFGPSNSAARRPIRLRPWRHLRCFARS